MIKTLGFVSMIAAGCLVFAPFADAQEMDFPQLLGSGVQGYGDVPGVPDAHGCIKSCFEDYSPCDPPAYKHADGRCETRRFGRR